MSQEPELFDVVVVGAGFILALNTVFYSFRLFSGVFACTPNSKVFGRLNTVSSAPSSPGVSGIGAIHWLKTECPNLSFIVLEKRDNIGVRRLT
jgi:hypothetical protein